MVVFDFLPAGTSDQLRQGDVGSASYGRRAASQLRKRQSRSKRTDLNVYRQLIFFCSQDDLECNRIADLLNNVTLLREDLLNYRKESDAMMKAFVKQLNLELEQRKRFVLFLWGFFKKKFFSQTSAGPGPRND